MHQATKVGLCLLAIAALLAAVGCGKKVIISGEDKTLGLYPIETILQAEQWVTQSVANSLAAQGVGVQGPIRIRSGTEKDPSLMVIAMLTNVNPQAGESISKMIAGLCMQALPKYEQVSIVIDLPQESLGRWIWNKNGELVEYTPPGMHR